MCTSIVDIQSVTPEIRREKKKKKKKNRNHRTAMTNFAPGLQFVAIVYDESNSVAPSGEYDGIF